MSGALSSVGTLRRRLVDLGARGEHELADAVLAAGVDHVDHAAHADVEHQVGLGVEEFGAVDEGEVMHFVHAFRAAARPRRRRECRRR